MKILVIGTLWLSLNGSHYYTFTRSDPMEKRTCEFAAQKYNEAMSSPVNGRPGNFASCEDAP